MPAKIPAGPSNQNSPTLNLQSNTMNRNTFIDFFLKDRLDSAFQKIFMKGGNHRRQVKPVYIEPQTEFCQLWETLQAIGTAVIEKPFPFL